MSNQPVIHDERTISVENASYRLAYLVMSFGLLLSIAYRGLVLNQSSWDLLALVVIGGIVASAYQGAHQILSRRWTLVASGVVLLAAAIAAVLVLTR